MSQCPGDLLRQPVMQAVDQVANVIGDIAEVQILPFPIAGIQNFSQIVGDFHDHIDTWQGAMSQVVDGFDFVIGVDDPVRQLGQAFLQTNISGHQPFLMFSSAAGIGSEISQTDLSGTRS